MHSPLQRAPAHNVCDARLASGVPAVADQEGQVSQVFLSGASEYSVMCKMVQQQSLQVQHCLPCTSCREYPGVCSAPPTEGTPAAEAPCACCARVVQAVHGASLPCTQGVYQRRETSGKQDAFVRTASGAPQAADIGINTTNWKKLTAEEKSAARQVGQTPVLLPAALGAVCIGVKSRLPGARRGR